MNSPWNANWLSIKSCSREGLHPFPAFHLLSLCIVQVLCMHSDHVVASAAHLYFVAASFAAWQALSAAWQERACASMSSAHSSCSAAAFFVSASMASSCFLSSRRFSSSAMSAAHSARTPSITARGMRESIERIKAKTLATSFSSCAACCKERCVTRASVCVHVVIALERAALDSCGASTGCSHHVPRRCAVPKPPIQY